MTKTLDKNHLCLYNTITESSKKHGYVFFYITDDKGSKIAYIKIYKYLNKRGTATIYILDLDKWKLYDSKQLSYQIDFFKSFLGCDTIVKSIVGKIYGGL